MIICANDYLMYCLMNREITSTTKISLNERLFTSGQHVIDISKKKRCLRCYGAMRKVPVV